MTERDARWNRFITDICPRSLDALSAVQKRAVLCFRYDAQMNSGGFSAYLASYPDADPQTLADALRAVGNEALAANFEQAAANGARDCWLATDRAFYAFSPSLCDCIRAYVEAHRTEIF